MDAKVLFDKLSMGQDMGEFKKNLAVALEDEEVNKHGAKVNRCIYEQGAGVCVMLMHYIRRRRRWKECESPAGETRFSLSHSNSLTHHYRQFINSQ